MFLNKASFLSRTPFSSYLDRQRCRSKVSACKAHCCLPWTWNLLNTALSFFIDSVRKKGWAEITTLGFLNLFRVTVGCLPVALGAVKSIWQVWFMTQHRHWAPVVKGLHVWACLELCACVSVRAGGGTPERCSSSHQSNQAGKGSRSTCAHMQIRLLHVITSYANLEAKRLRPRQVPSDGASICPSRPLHPHHPIRLGALGERLKQTAAFTVGFDPREGRRGLREGRVWHREQGQPETDGRVWDDLCAHESATLSLRSWISHSVPSLPSNRKAPLMERSNVWKSGWKQLVTD